MRPSFHWQLVFSRDITDVPETLSLNNGKREGERRVIASQRRSSIDNLKAEIDNDVSSAKF